MARTPQDREHFIPRDLAGDVYSYAWDAVPVPVPLSDEDEGASAISSYTPTGAKGPHCIRAGLSRAAIHIVRLSQFDGAAAIPPVPPRVSLSVWGRVGEISSLIATAQWSPATWTTAAGFLIQVAGVLVEGFELRWRVDGTSPAPAVPRQLRAHLRWIVDREGAGFELLSGPNVANVVTPIGKV